MTSSMTGFARVQSEGEWGEMTWELRSVNHRYLEVSPRLPEALRALEPAVREAAAQRLSRGKIEITARLTSATVAQAIEIDTARLDRLADALSTVRDRVIDCRAPDALRLLSFPGVQKEAEPDTGQLQSDALAALHEGLDELARMRLAEGQRLADLLRARAKEIGEHADAAAARLPQVRRAWQDKLHARLAEADVQADPARIEQELVFAAQRMDIAEEIDRLHSHIAALEQALDPESSQKGGIGRRLDFLMQEFNREANTLGSKSQDSELTAHAVEMKVLIEQMREQVQNIE